MSTDVTITGNLTADPDIRFTKTGKAVVRLSVATSRRVQDSEGKWSDAETTFWSVTAWEQLGENVAESLAKGDPVIVVGRAFMESYEKDGEKRQVLKVNATNVGPDLRKRVASVRKVERSKASAGVVEDVWSTPVQDEVPPF